MQAQLGETDPLDRNGRSPAKLYLVTLEAGRAYYLEMKEQEGWSRERLAPLLAGLLELIPWLRQWHDEVDPDYGFGMGEYFAQFLEQQAG